mgnify:CR=1 FL=1
MTIDLARISFYTNFFAQNVSWQSILVMLLFTMLPLVTTTADLFIISYRVFDNASQGRCKQGVIELLLGVSFIIQM